MNKVFVFILIVIIFTLPLWAQDDFGIPEVLPKELTYPCNSAPPSGGTVLFNVDVIDTANDAGDVLPLTAQKVYISTDGQSSWSNYDLTLDGTTDYETTFYYNWSPASNFYYYYQFETDSTISSQSPINSGHAFPPSNNLMANFHDDPAGDDLPFELYETHNWDNTDLRNFKLSHSSSRFYTRITSNGGFATSHDNLKQHDCFWGDKEVDVYHLYAAPLINPNAPYPDSIFYAIIYGDMDISFIGIGVTITPGVYKIVSPGEDAGISEYLNAYEKISDGTNYGYNISGNELDMWCDLDVLTSDSDFGELTEDSLLITGAGIASACACYKGCGSLVTDTFAYVVHDFSRNSAFYMQTPDDIVDVNDNFTLSDVSWSSEADGYTISINYNDPDNNCPVQRQLEIGGCYPGTYTMTSADHKYDDGSTFSASFSMPTVLKIPYRFIFDDGITLTTTAWDTINTGATGVDILANGLESVTINLDSMSCNEEIVLGASDSINIMNQSAVPVDLGAQIISISGGGMDVYAGNEPAIDTFAIYAILNDTELPPLPIEFESPENALTTGTMLWANGTNMGGGGLNILPACYNGDITGFESQTEKLWIKLMTPTYVSDMFSAVDFTINIEVRARAHLF